jgi:hypothetical protein
VRVNAKAEYRIEDRELRAALSSIAELAEGCISKERQCISKQSHQQSTVQDTVLAHSTKGARAREEGKDAKDRVSGGGGK